MITSAKENNLFLICIALLYSVTQAYYLFVAH